ncbi:hypothetical protein [Paraburkholderia aromaticivorans]|uniref:hypothetical protein n=1 Tax=Paraburkholderia aromaticivorans TaxID=2026199 RepID=UPI001455F617|nr:hypothetical protein [Paraburkholderia aromaticivorans]
MASVQQVADSIEVSKALVMKRKASEGWQLGIGVAGVTTKGPSGERSYFTESAVGSGTRAGIVTGHQAEKQPAAPAAHAAQSEGRSARPQFPNGADEIEWIEQQVSIREKAILDRHTTELRALTNSIYDAARKTGKVEMGAASRAANQLSQALERKQKLEREHCAMQTRIELGAHYGAGPRPAVIVVHCMPGVAIGEANDDEAVMRRAHAAARFVETRKCAKEVEVRND